MRIKTLSPRYIRILALFAPYPGKIDSTNASAGIFLNINMTSLSVLMVVKYALELISLWYLISTAILIFTSNGTFFLLSITKLETPFSQKLFNRLTNISILIVGNKFKTSTPFVLSFQRMILAFGWIMIFHSLQVSQQAMQAHFSIPNLVIGLVLVIISYI